MLSYTLRDVQDSPQTGPSRLEPLVSERDANLTALDCDCAAPCYRVLYDPSISSAWLSAFNIDKVSIDTDARRVEVETKFHNAREVSQTVIKVSLILLSIA